MRTTPPLLAAATLLLAGCGGGAAASAPSTPATFTVLGNLSIMGGSCVLSRGYDDIEAGAQVTVTDGSGTTLALGRLGEGQFTRDEQYPTIGTCAFPISVSGVPRGKGFYGIEVAHRGVLRYVEADIVTKPVQLKLG